MMRTNLRVVLTAALFGLVPLAPQASAHWECMGPAVACEGSGAARSSYNGGFSDEMRGRRYAERAYARQHADRELDERVTSRRASHRPTSADQAAAPRQQTARLETPEAAQTPAKPEALKQEARKQEAQEQETKAQEAVKQGAQKKEAAKQPEVTVRKVATQGAPVAPAPVRLAGTGKTQSGMASFYGTESGSQTTSGERFNPRAMTAAHRSLPLPTYARVTNLSNGQSIVVRVNDRGPFHQDRIIDLSTAAADAIGMRGAGVAPVSVEVLGRS